MISAPAKMDAAAVPPHVVQPIAPIHREPLTVNAAMTTPLILPSQESSVSPGTSSGGIHNGTGLKTARIVPMTLQPHMTSSVLSPASLGAPRVRHAKAVGTPPSTPLVPLGPTASIGIMAPSPRLVTTQGNVVLQAHVQNSASPRTMPTTSMQHHLVPVRQPVQLAQTQPLVMQKPIAHTSS